MKIDTQKKIARNLKLLRVNKGMNQEEMAKTIGIGRSNYAQYELGIRTPDAEFLFTVAKIFGIKMDLLFESSEEKFMSEVIYYEVCDDGDAKLLSMFRKLTPFSKGRLIEKAEILLDWDAFRAGQLKSLKERVCS